MNSLIDLDSKYIKSYKTKANLEKAITDLGYQDLPKLFACNSAGRHVVIFLGQQSNKVLGQFPWIMGY